MAFDGGVLHIQPVTRGFFETENADTGNTGDLASGVGVSGYNKLSQFVAEQWSRNQLMAQRRDAGPA